jgi:hypothetical protein
MRKYMGKHYFRTRRREQTMETKHTDHADSKSRKMYILSLSLTADHELSVARKVSKVSRINNSEMPSIPAGTGYSGFDPTGLFHELHAGGQSKRCAG